MAMPEVAKYTADVIDAFAAETLKRIKIQIAHYTKNLSQNEELRTRPRLNILDCMNDAEFYLEELQKISEAIRLNARIQLRKNNSEVKTRRWLFEDGELREASLEECADADGITVTEYLQKEQEQLQDFPEELPDEHVPGNVSFEVTGDDPLYSIPE